MVDIFLPHYPIMVFLFGNIIHAVEKYNDLVGRQRNEIRINFDFNILVDLHLDDVHRVILVIALDFKTIKTCTK